MFRHIVDIRQGLYKKNIYERCKDGIEKGKLVERVGEMVWGSRLYRDVVSEETREFDKVAAWWRNRCHTLHPNGVRLVGDTTAN